MKRKIYAAICIVLMLVNLVPLSVWASSHREAPLILADPNADNTDLYAFRINVYCCLISVPLHGVCANGNALLKVVSFFSTPVEYCSVLISWLVIGDCAGLPGL